MPESYTLIIMLVLLSIGLAPAALDDYDDRLVDDRMWFFLLLPYAYLIYSSYMGFINLSDILEGLILLPIIIIPLVIIRKVGGLIGSADYIMYALISPFSTYLHIPVAGISWIPGVLIFIILTCILGIVYSVSKCIIKNRRLLKDSLKVNLIDFIKMLYSYKTSNPDNNKEIILSKIDDNKYIVTPGIPLITMGLISLIILLIINLLINYLIL